MKITTALLCSALAATVMAGQPAGAPAPSSKPGTVDGVVTSSVTGEPVRKAVVSLRSQSQGFAYQAVTDAAGHFHCDDVDPGSYGVTAARDGFAQPMPGRRHEKQLTVADDQNVTGVAVRLVPLADLAGHVMDDDGDPIVLASVVALRWSYIEGRKQLNQVAAISSNDLGEFQFVNLAPGRYYFRVSPPARTPNLPARTRISRPEEAYPPTFYPTGADPGQATVVNLTPGADVSGIDFRLRKALAYHVRGKVVDGRTGQSARNLGVMLMPDGPVFISSGGEAGVQPDGTFDLRAIVKGSYVLTAQNWERSVESSARQAVLITDHDVSVLLTLSSGFEVTGRISVEGPAPAQMNAQVFLNPDRGGAGFQAPVGGDGSFVLSNVTPTTYRIGVLPGAAGLYVKSIRFGDQDITDGLINVTQPGTSLNILFGTDGGDVQGAAETASGEPAPNAPVTLAPTGQHESRPDLVKETRTDRYGHFQFQDVAPGDYQVFAWDGEDGDMDFGLVPNVDFRKALSSQAASVAVGPSASESVQLKLISAEDIEQARNKLP